MGTLLGINYVPIYQMFGCPRTLEDVLVYFQFT